MEVLRHRRLTDCITCCLPLMGDRLVLFHVMETICTKIFIAFLYFKMGHWTQKPSSCVKQSFIKEELANEMESGVLSFYI